MMLLAAFETSEEPRSIRADQNPAAEEEIRSLEFKLVQQILSGDSAYGNSLAEDYVLIGSYGTTHTKQEMTATFVAQRPGNRIESMQLSNLKIRVYGDTAVMNFEVSLIEVIQGRRIASHEKATKVFIKRNGRWYMVNNQGTSIPTPTEAPK
jgi:hypothetical protein